MGERHHHSGKALIFVVVLTALFMVLEAVGGLLSNSLALLTDAAHMLTDVGALCLSLFALWVSRKPKTPRMTFGFQRAEILGAFLSGSLILILSGVLIYEAIHRLLDPPEVQGLWVLAIAAVGLVVNVIAMRVLHSSQNESLNVRAAYLHVLGDLLGSVGALIAGLLIWLTGISLIDPIVTFLIAILVIWSASRLVWETVTILMEGVPRSIDSEKMKRDLEELPLVEGVHDLHVWSLSSSQVALSVHLVSKKSSEALESAKVLLDQSYGIHHTTIQIEDPEQYSKADCGDCHDGHRPG